MVIQQLIYLNALARERHFGRAAAACHVSQATLSKAIQRLEDEFDVPLVRRGHQFEELTPEGARAVAWAQRILADCEGMEADLALMHSGTGGKLRLGAIPTSLPAVPRLTGAMRRRHPELRFAIRSLSSREIERGLQESELDAGVTYLHNEPLSGVRSRTLYEEGYVFVAPGESEWADGERISWAAAAEAPLCLLSPDMQNRRIVDRNFAEAGSQVHPVVETNSISTLHAHVREGRLCAVLADSWLRAYSLGEGMSVLLLEPERRQPIGIVWADGEPTSAMARALVEAAEEFNPTNPVPAPSSYPRGAPSTSPRLRP